MSGIPCSDGWLASCLISKLKFNAFPDLRDSVLKIVSSNFYICRVRAHSAPSLQLPKGMMTWSSFNSILFLTT